MLWPAPALVAGHSKCSAVPFGLPTADRLHVGAPPSMPAALQSPDPSGASVRRHGTSRPSPGAERTRPPGRATRASGGSLLEDSASPGGFRSQGELPSSTGVWLKMHDCAKESSTRTRSDPDSGRAEPHIGLAGDPPVNRRRLLVGNSPVCQARLGRAESTRYFSPGAMPVTRSRSWGCPQRLSAVV
jgi:hypothetical protein